MSKTLNVYFFRCMNGYTSGLQIAIAYNLDDAIDHIVKTYEQDLQKKDRDFDENLWYQYKRKSLRKELTESGPFKVVAVSDGVAGYCGGGS